jgi:hypothetical protein
VPGRVLVDNLAAALPDHAQHGAALGRPAADDAQRQAVDRPDPSRQSLRQHRSRAARLDPGGRIGAAPRRDDRRRSHAGRRGAIRRAGDVDDGCLGCFGNFGFPPTAVVHSRFGERRESTQSGRLDWRR